MEFKEENRMTRKIIKEKQDPEVNDASSSHFFIFHFFFYNFSFFNSHCRSFLLVPHSSLFILLPRPAVIQSFKIHKRPFFTEFDESVTDQRTDGRTDGRADKASYRDARTHLKKVIG